MNEMRDVFDGLFQAPAQENGSLAPLLASLFMAVFLGLAIAWVYQRTHQGLSYSRGFTQSLVVITLGASLLVHVIGESLVTAFGLLGALAIVRFRNVLKDTRDAVFVLASLIIGMAAGTQRFGVALVGAAVLLAVLVYLHVISFGTRSNIDGHVSYSLTDDRSGTVRAQVESVLAAFCRAVHPVTSHDLGGPVEIVSAVRLRDPQRGSEMVRLLRSLPGVDDASLVTRDAHTEM